MHDPTGTTRSGRFLSATSRTSPYVGWREAVGHIRPDVIYALLNWQAVPFAHDVLRAIPVSPSSGTSRKGRSSAWKRAPGRAGRPPPASDGQIFSSPEMRDWFDAVFPARRGACQRSCWTATCRSATGSTMPRSPRLSAGWRAAHRRAGAADRPAPATVGELAAHGVHLHFYGDFTHGQWRDWVEKTRKLAPGHLHLHPNVDQCGWMASFRATTPAGSTSSRSENGGRYSPRQLGRPQLSGANGHPHGGGASPCSSATTRALWSPPKRWPENWVRELFFNDMAGLANQLRDREIMAKVRANVARHRDTFAFDHHASSLVDFFRKVIKSKSLE